MLLFIKYKCQPTFNYTEKLPLFGKHADGISIDPQCCPEWLCLSISSVWLIKSILLFLLILQVWSSVPWLLFIYFLGADYLFHPTVCIWGYNFLVSWFEYKCALWLQCKSPILLMLKQISTKCPPNLYAWWYFLLSENSFFILKWGQWVNHEVIAVSKTWTGCSLEELLSLSYNYLSYVANLLYSTVSAWGQGAHFPDFPGAQEVHTQTSAGKTWWEGSRTTEKRDQRLLM